MLHQLLFLGFYLGMLPMAFISPMVGVLLYTWLDNLPPDDVYSLTIIPGYVSFVTGALAFFGWLVFEKKTIPRAPVVIFLMTALWVWIVVTSFYALAPAAGAYEWTRTVKLIAFAILTAQMLSTRARLEAFVWVFVLCTIYFAIPGAIKLIVSGGSGGIGEGEVVTAATGSFFGDRVIFSVVLAMALPFALYLRRCTMLLPPRWLKWVKVALLGAALSFLLALIGTFARTALIAGGATLLMLAIRSRRKTISVVLTVAIAAALFAIAPENWFARMDTIVHYEGDDSALSRLDAWKWAWQMAMDHPIVGGGFGVFVLDVGSIKGRPGWLEAHNIFLSIAATQGLVGLGLFCGLIAAIYRSCTVIQKRVRNNDEMAWAADLARSTQISLVAFVAGGMFVSIATSPFLYTLAAITVGTRNLVERERAATAPNKRLIAPSRAAPQAAE
jgi:probable O-glycosylation ligase (exosortase A-associated)